ncbi:MAG: arsenate reductase ArsC [Fusobacteria bacterium]|nr:arsenate reductase ArsC [Fusobacteriota bacterium]
MLNVLFLCTGNSCRSQMAEAIAKRELQSANFYSAGIETHGMNLYAVKVCEELGLDMSQATSKLVSDIDVEFDIVLTVCDHAAESCPMILTKARRVHHSFQDPPKLVKDIEDEQEKLKIYRLVRDEIKSYLTTEFKKTLKGE